MSQASRKSPPAKSVERPASLRERHLDTTREAVLDAFVDLLEKDGAFEFSFFELARRSGVSVRTIYRHFPTREALFDAMSARVNERVGFREYPTERAGVVELARKIFQAFDRESALINAQLQAGVGLQLRSHAQKQRVAAIVEAVRRHGPALDTARVRLHAGAIACLLSADAWMRLERTLGMDGVEAGEAIAQAIDTLFSAVEAENERAERAQKSAKKRRGE